LGNPVHLRQFRSADLASTLRSIEMIYVNATGAAFARSSHEGPERAKVPSPFAPDHLTRHPLHGGHATEAPATQHRPGLSASGVTLIDLLVITAETDPRDDPERPMRVTFYGKLAGMFGRELDLAIETPCTVSALRNRIAQAYPELAPSLRDRRVRACVGSTLVPDDHSLAQTDIVEFLAPVSGG
jgi:sulfur-carrier protein